MKEGVVVIGMVLVVTLVGLFFAVNTEEPHIIIAPSGITGAQVFEPPVLLPATVTILDISPNNVSQASTLEYTLTGFDFNSSAVVSTSNPDVSVLSTIIVNDTEILVNITVAFNASIGLYDVVVTQDNESSTLISGLEIYEGPFDPASLINLSAGYYLFNYTSNSTDPVTLIYNITTAPGVDKSIVNITGGYLEVTDVNTSNDTYINLTSAVDPEGTFTLTFDPTIFYEEGDYEVELYVDVLVNGEYAEREYYGPYFGVGAPTCSIIPPCNFVGTVGVPDSLVIPVNGVIGVVTICQLLTPPAGCAAVIGPGDACTINCNSPVAGLFNSGLTASDSASFCIPFPFIGGLPCTFTFTNPTPPPVVGGGSSGGTNSYVGSVICPTYCDLEKYSHVSICASPACQAAASIKAGPPPGVTYSGPSEEEKVPPVFSPPVNQPVNIQMPPESRVPLDRRTVVQEPMAEPFKVPPDMRRPPTVPIEELEKYRTLQPEKTVAQRVADSFVGFLAEIKSLFVGPPVRTEGYEELVGDKIFALAPGVESPVLAVRTEGFTELVGDIIVLKTISPFDGLPGPDAVIRAHANDNIAVGPDDILVFK